MFEVIVDVCDKVEITRETVDRLLRYARDDYSVIAIDNASSDGIDEYLRQLADEGKLKLVRLDERVGIAASKNEGICASEAEFLIILDDDVWAESQDWWRTLIGALYVFPGTALVGPCGSLIEDLNGESTNWFPHGYENQPYFGEATTSGPFGMKVDSIPGMCCGYRRQAVIDVGMFDVVYDPLFVQDADLCIRLKEVGWDIRLATAHVTHVGDGRKSHKAVEESTGKSIATVAGESMDIFKQRWAGNSNLLELHK